MLITDKLKDNKFSIRQILDKSDNQEGYRKSFFVLSEDLKEEDEEMSNKLKRELLIKRLISDKLIITDKLLPDKLNKLKKKHKEKTEVDIFNENVVSQIYIGVSPESREFQLDK